MGGLKRDAKWHQLAPGGGGAVAAPPSALPTSLVDILSDNITVEYHSTMRWTRVEKEHRINSHLIIHCPTTEGVSKVSERTNE